MPYSFDKEHLVERYHCQTCGHDHDVERCPRCGSNQKDSLSGLGTPRGGAFAKQMGGGLHAATPLPEPPASLCTPE